ncbi:MAG TPA: class I SAM-dependent methyltransferase [Anaerolineaceae bacterium]|nr:class I SAM-dependent methyltransferase [Anaerolineaceae bacterium]
MKELLNVGEALIFCNVLSASRPAAVDAPRGKIDLVYCDQCTHIYNRSFQPELVEYSEGYENSLHFSPFFQNYARWLADELITRYDLHGKNLIEIGSGKGDFLRMFCELGRNWGTGYDPSFPVQGELVEQDGRVRLVKGLFSPHRLDYPADLVYSRHTLEHLPDPAGFVRLVRESIDNPGKTVLFLEVPNAPLIFEALSIWDIIYEHFSYFSQVSLVRLIQENGFQFCSVYETYAGQFLCIEANPDGCAEGLGQSTNEAHVRYREAISRFADNYQKKLIEWKKCLAALQEEGKKVVVWGAGSKGVSFLNLLKEDTPIEFVVDINPRKTGQYMPASGQQVVAPEFLCAYQPDAVIVMNPNYRDEISARLRALGLTPKLLLA